MICLNGTLVTPTMFPDNTSQVWKINELFRYTMWITLNFTHESEIMHLKQLKDLLDSSPKVHQVILKMPFLPYGRQDKEVSNEATFALSSFASLINDMKFHGVVTFDAHSDKFLELFNNSKNLMPFEEIEAARLACNPNIICFPDLGAKKRYYRVSLPTSYAEKTRDSLTGYISDVTVYGETEDKKVLIVDDICDGGMTFILLADELISKGAKEINLYVSHGIFSKGLRPLKAAGINKIYTKDGEMSEFQHNLTLTKWSDLS